MCWWAELTPAMPWLVKLPFVFPKPKYHLTQVPFDAIHFFNSLQVSKINHVRQTGLDALLRFLPPVTMVLRVGVAQGNLVHVASPFVLEHAKGRVEV